MHSGRCERQVPDGRQFQAQRRDPQVWHKEGQTVGSGGQRRRGLEARGATPKAEDRVYHAAHRRKVAAQKQAAKRPRRDDDAPEYVLGRNPVVECLRAGVPATALYLVTGVEADERITEAVGIAGAKGISILEVTKNELDRMSSNGLHQGIGLQVPPYVYAPRGPSWRRRSRRGSRRCWWHSTTSPTRATSVR